MSIWTTANNSSGLDTPQANLLNRQLQQHQQKLTEQRKSSNCSLHLQPQHNNQKTQSSPGSLSNILSGTHFVNYSPSGGIPAHSNNAIHIGVAVGAASSLASSILQHTSVASQKATNNNSDCGNCTYPQQRHSLSQSEILSYSPPNPKKVRNVCICISLSSYFFFL